MVFIHQNPSVIEWLGVIAFVVIAVIAAVLFIKNYPGMQRYLRIRHM